MAGAGRPELGAGNVDEGTCSAGLASTDGRGRRPSVRLLCRTRVSGRGRQWGRDRRRGRVSGALRCGERCTGGDVATGRRVRTVLRSGEVEPRDGGVRQLSFGRPEPESVERSASARRRVRHLQRLLVGGETCAGGGARGSGSAGAQHVGARDLHALPAAWTEGRSGPRRGLPDHGGGAVRVSAGRGGTVRAPTDGARADAGADGARFGGRRVVADESATRGGVCHRTGDPVRVRLDLVQGRVRG